MTKKNEIQYIRLYTNGSSACSVDFSTPEKKVRNKTKLPKAKPQQMILIRWDPMAFCGIVVAAVMFVMMFVSCFQLVKTQNQAQTMQAYVAHLQTQNTQLQIQYEESYDLEEVEKSALALGMIPASQATTIFVDVEEEEIVEEPTFWNRLSMKLDELFA